MRDDVVWRADTGQYHARERAAPVLMPPMLGAQASPAAPCGEGTARAPSAAFAAWFQSPEATNVLLLLLLIAILIRGD